MKISDLLNENELNDLGIFESDAGTTSTSALASRVTVLGGGKSKTNKQVKVKSVDPTKTKNISIFGDIIKRNG